MAEGKIDRTGLIVIAIGLLLGVGGVVTIYYGEVRHPYCGCEGHIWNGMRLILFAVPCFILGLVLIGIDQLKQLIQRRRGRNQKP